MQGFLAPPQMMQQGAMIPQYGGGGSLAAALAQPRQFNGGGGMANMPGIPLASLLQQMQQGGAAPSASNTSAPTAAYAAMSPQDMAKQMSSNMPMGAQGSASAQYLPQQNSGLSTGWLDRLFGRGGN